jgi:catechol 2,3-dioxygenase-like lactoylglutathione lyase family enzyme
MYKAEHIGVYASDPIRLAQWYIDKLGFKVVRTLEKEGRPPIYFLEGDGGTVLEILPTNLNKSERDLSAPGFSHLGLVVVDFEKSQQKLEENGVMVENVRKTSNGWTIGYFKDPEGNQLELVFRPKS